MLHDQYEVLGCLAHGGLGWIYLALDRAVADRWVVLKGLLDTGDADAMAAAVAERRFLAEVEHPNIVKIHNFVQHHDAATKHGGRLHRDGVRRRPVPQGHAQGDPRRPRARPACLPLPRAIAYALEMLPPIGYLHSLDLLFCDFKPDNVVQTEEQLKLLDLGAVRHVDDEDSAVYGTIGYQAPEIATAGPSVVLGPVHGRPHARGDDVPVRLPARARRPRCRSAADEPLLAEFESYDRLLRRATAPDPGARFTSAEEMKDQLTGVLREVLAAEDGLPRPGASTEFTPERRSFGVRTDLAPPDDLRAIVDVLPVPRVDGADPAAAFLATVTATEPAELLGGAEDRAEVHCGGAAARRCGRTSRLGDVATARRLLDELDRDPAVTPERSWLVDWHRGLAALAEGDTTVGAPAVRPRVLGGAR